MPDYAKLIEYFDVCICHYAELLDFENEKLRLIASENIIELQNKIPKEQALIMKGNALEAKRIEIMKKEGLDGKRFEQLIENAPDEFKTALIRSRDSLSKYINEIRRINSNAMQTVSTRLSRLEKLRSNLSTDTYDGKGEKKHSVSSSSSLSKNV